LLREKGATLSTAESCTGGAVAAALVTVPGSSDYFLGSIVSYANAVKMDVLGVTANALENHGAVSKEVVEQMAAGVRNRLQTTYSLALSGVAGPDGGSDEKPVGTVWIALAGPNGVRSKCFRFETDRQRNIQRAVLTALNLLRCELLEINIEKS
jgi:nicotinamide-nucleotide amidase